MSHGIVDVFAFQEALLIEAVFGIALLTMIWVGFRRWLQHKERMGRLIAEQTAERAGQHGAQMARVEARLNAVEQIVIMAASSRPRNSARRATKPLTTDPSGFQPNPSNVRYGLKATIRREFEIASFLPAHFCVPLAS